MKHTTITSTELERDLERYLDETAKGPIYITDDGETKWVLVSATEYERLKQTDNR